MSSSSCRRAAIAPESVNGPVARPGNGSAKAGGGTPDQAALAQELEDLEPALAGQAGSLLATFPSSYASATPVAEMVDELSLVLAQPGPREVVIRVEAGK